MALILASLLGVLSTMSMTGYVQYRGSNNRIETYTENFNINDYFSYEVLPTIEGDDVVASNFDQIKLNTGSRLNLVPLVSNSPASFDDAYIRVGYRFNITYNLDDVGSVNSILFDIYIAKGVDGAYSLNVSSGVGYTNFYINGCLGYFGYNVSDYGFNYTGGFAGFPSMTLFDNLQIYTQSDYILFEKMSIRLLDKEVYDAIYGAFQQDDYNYGYTQGFKNGDWNGQQVGYENGYREGFDDGKEDGIDLGRLQGYNEGYVAGAQSTGNPSFMGLFTSIADTPILMIRRLFGFEIFGTSALAVVFSLLTAFIIIKIVKKVLK